MALQIIFNPLTSEFQFIDGTGSGPTVQTPNFIATFNNTTSWSGPAVGEYTIVVAAATHGKGTNPMVQILELSGSDYTNLLVTYKIATNGDVTITVPETPDLRFNGRIYIAENN